MVLKNELHKKPCIICVAITGSVPTKEDNANVPISINEQIESTQESFEMGATIAPPLPAFYPNPKSLDDIINHSVGKVLDLFNINMDVVKRWEGIKARV